MSTEFEEQDIEMKETIIDPDVSNIFRMRFLSCRFGGLAMSHWIYLHRMEQKW